MGYVLSQPIIEKKSKQTFQRIFFFFLVQFDCEEERNERARKAKGGIKR